MTERDPIQSLVIKAQEGDHAAYEQLVERYRGELRVAIRSRIGAHLRHKLDEEDLLQDVFTRAFQSIERFRWQSKDSFYHWLKGISENLILKAAERQQREQLLLIRRQRQFDAPSFVSPSKAARRDERFERLEKALDSLSPEHKEVILLARVEGLEIKQIATRLNKSVSAVKGLLFRALKGLKSSFGDTESLGLPARKLGGREHADG